MTRTNRNIFLLIVRDQKGQRDGDISQESIICTMKDRLSTRFFFVVELTWMKIFLLFVFRSIKNLQMKFITVFIPIENESFIPETKDEWIHRSGKKKNNDKPTDSLHSLPDWSDDIVSVHSIVKDNRVVRHLCKRISFPFVVL